MYNFHMRTDELKVPKRATQNSRLGEWWQMPVIPAFGRLKNSSLCYIVSSTPAWAI
jgi:hypothetical protein